MSRKLNLNIFYLSTLFTLLSAYILPCRHIDNLNKSFGFPLGWFTVHDNTIGDVIINSTAVNPIRFFTDIVLFYFIILCVYKLHKKNKKDNV